MGVKQRLHQGDFALATLAQGGLMDFESKLDAH
jgi:hypothetical protein